MNWKIGDIAILIGCGYAPNCKHNVGRECELISIACEDGYDWVIVAQGELREMLVQAKHLQPLPPPNEVTSWDDCIFQPQELVRLDLIEDSPFERIPGA